MNSFRTLISKFQSIGCVAFYVVILFLTAACATQVDHLSITPTLSDSITTLPSQEVESFEMDKLDLRYANVVDVKFDRVDKTTYTFDVTLYHDDEGESPNFADWWQVDDLEGNELGRRVLLHAHSTAPFTRSQKITIPPSISVVLVRGHDMTHDYGGQVMRVDLVTGTTTPLPHP